MKIFFNKQGFSLVELAVVLVIVGIISSFFLEFSTFQAEAEKVRTTNQRLDEIEKAIFAYQQAYGDLPCPADPDLLKTAQYYGRVVESSEGSCVVDLRLQDSSGTEYRPTGTYVGSVPIYLLGLDEKLMYDGWGNRIDYIVDSAAVNKNNYSLSNIIKADGSFTLSTNWTLSSAAIASGELTITGAANAYAASELADASPLTNGVFRSVANQIYKISFDARTVGANMNIGFAASAAGCDDPMSATASTGSFTPTYGSNVKILTVTDTATTYEYFCIFSSSNNVIDNLKVEVTSLPYGSSGEINIYDTTDNDGTTSTTDSQDLINGQAVYVIISHGKNGYGAYNNAGIRNTAAVTGSTSEYEIENVHIGGTYDADFRVGPLNDTTAAGTSYFDDIVRWKSYEQLRYK